ncbi:hypothetical protein D3C86_1708670 [compost metagenome]
MTGFEHQDFVARTQGIAQRRFPGTGARSGVDDHRMAGLENLFDAFQHLEPQLPELRATVIDGGITHGAQDAIRHRARPWNLQKVTASGVEIELQHG